MHRKTDCTRSREPSGGRRTRWQCDGLLQPRGTMPAAVYQPGDWSIELPRWVPVRFQRRFCDPGRLHSRLSPRRVPVVGVLSVDEKRPCESVSTRTAVRFSSSMIEKDYGAHCPCLPVDKRAGFGSKRMQ